MAKKEEFKEFVKKNPHLIKHVRTGSMTWQKFYEIYDLYGEEATAWKDYLEPEVAKVATDAAAGFSMGEVFNFLKNIDLDSVQNGVSSIQRVLGVLQDFSKSDKTPAKEEYKPRPLYRHFED